MMRVRLKRDISRCAARKLARLFERQRLGVLDALVDVEALADDLAAFVHDDASDERARTHLPRRARGEFERTRHHALIGVCKLEVGVRGQEILSEEAVDVLLGVEDDEVVHALADARVADGQAQLLRDGDGDAALGRAVELR